MQRALEVRLQTGTPLSQQQPARPAPPGRDGATGPGHQGGQPRDQLRVGAGQREQASQLVGHGMRGIGGELLGPVQRRDITAETAARAMARWSACLPKWL